MLIQIEKPGVSDHGPAVLRAGFRPFFLLAGLQGAVMVPLWLLFLSGGGQPAVPAWLWHGHEMVFGFAVAAVCGFLLTAVPNWTGAAGVKGWRLGLLAGLWLAARIAFLGGLPVVVGAACDLLLLPALGGLLARPLILAGKLRNMAFLLLLSILTLCDALVLAEMLGWTAGTGRIGLWGGVFLLCMMIAIVGGRIIPGFTQNGLRQVGVTVQPLARPWLDKAALAWLALSAIGWLVLPESRVAGAVCLLAAVVHLVRMAGWHGQKTARVPLLWILHAGYLWLPVGLALLGASTFIPSLLPPALALHALTAGCIGSMVIGVMSRAALGHSGRPLQPSGITVAAYGFIQAGALLRVFGLLAGLPFALDVSGALWSLGWLLFVLVYAPICLKPREDGRPG